jgi:hypothetical protein
MKNLKLKTKEIEKLAVRQAFLMITIEYIDVHAA